MSSISSVSPNEILHCDYMGQVSFVKPIQKCTRASLTFGVADLADLLDELKDQFAKLNEKYPVHLKEGDDYALHGQISDTGCRAMATEILSSSLVVTRKSTKRYEELLDTVRALENEVTDFLRDFAAFVNRFRAGHFEFEQLEKMVLKHLDEDQFFLARTKFQKTVDKHKRLIEQKNDLELIGRVIVDRLAGAIQLCDFSERLCGTMNMICDYLVQITKRQDLLCMMTRAATGHKYCSRCYHQGIKCAFDLVVASHNAGPDPLVFLKRIVRQSGIIDGTMGDLDNINEILLEDYIDFLFPIQVSLDTRIRKLEAKLPEPRHFDC